MKSTKRIITVLLALCLVTGLVPAVSAAEEIKNPPITFDDWDTYVEEMRKKNYPEETDTLPEGYDQSVIDAINNNVDNSISVSDDNSSDSSMQMSADAQAGLVTKDTASTQSTSSSTSSALPESFTVDPVADPFNLSAGAGDSVSLATGALTYEKTLLSLPGRNGHDLNISVRYNSDNAVITKSAYSDDNKSKNVNFIQFAIGWEFGFPNISLERYYGYSMDYTLNLPGGGSYRIDTSTESGFKNYKLDDMKIEITSTAYVLTYADGRKDYFDLPYGNITKSEDRFGNTITYEYEEIECYQNSFWDYIFKFNSAVQKKYALSKITDSTGREITFTYDTATTGMEKYITSIKVIMDGVTYATVSLKHVKSYNGTIDILEKITDAEGYVTSFVYDERIAHATYTDANQVTSYNPAGSGFVMTEIVLPTGGTISYEYEKARRNYTHILYSATMYYGLTVNWREVFKVSERTDSGGNKTWYSYENDRSGYPDSGAYINEDTGYVYRDNFLYYTTVTEGQLSTLYTFNNKHQKIHEESYSAVSGVNQLFNKGGTGTGIVINGKIYTVTFENDFLSVYTYDVTNTNFNSSYREKAFKPLYVGWGTNIGMIGVKSHGDNIYAFVAKNNDVVVYKFNTGDSNPSWSTELTYTYGRYIGTNSIVKYDGVNDKFYIYFLKVFSDGHTDVLQALEYNPSTKSMVDYYDYIEREDRTLEYFLCMNGNTAYFSKHNKIYRCAISDGEMTITSKDFEMAATSGFVIGSGASAKTYFVSDGSVYEFDYEEQTKSAVPQLTNVKNIIAGTDGKLYYTTITDTDSSAEGVANRKVLMSYDITADGSVPEIVYYCFSDTDEYTLLANYGGIYLKTDDRYEIAQSTTGKQTRIRADFTYNEYDQMTGYRKSVTEGGAISHQGGESYTYVPGQNALSSHTDILGNVTNYTYDTTYYLPRTVTQYAGTANELVTENTLSSDKKKIVSSITTYDDGTTHKVTNTYDTAYPGNVTGTKTQQLTNGANAKTISHVTYTYDSTNSLVASQTVQDIVTNTDQFTKGSAIDIATTFTYNDIGQVLTEKNSENQTTSYQYNKNGWQTKVTYPDNTYVSKTYDIGDTNKVTTSYNGKYFTVDYFDGMGRVTKQTKKATSNGTEATVAIYSYLLGRLLAVGDGTKADSYSYDNFNRISAITHGRPDAYTYNDRYTEITYDDLNLKVTTNTSDGRVSASYYDNAGRVLKETLGSAETIVTRYTYDYMGNLKTVTDPNGNTTTNNYNDKGQLTSVVNALNQSTRYYYDIYGNVSKVTTPGNSVLQYEYDNAGRLLKSTNALNASEHYAYDSIGNLLYEKDRKNQVTSYTYDNMNRLTGKTTGALSVAYTYDTLGNVLTMTDNGSETPTSYEYTYDGMLAKVTTPDNKSISYTYNNSGYMTGVTDYNGYSYTYTYDSSGNAGLISQKQGNTTLVTMSMMYSYPGVVTQSYMTEPENDGFTQEEYYNYNDAGRIIRKSAYMLKVFEDDQVITNRAYTYDLAGNITQETGDGTTTYEYDALNRIVDEVSGGSSTAYTYDANNNITKKVITENGVTTTKNYVYNAANRLEDHDIQDANGNTTFASVFCYDANGNLTQQHCNDTTSKYYSYDAWNRLTGYTSRDGVSTTYTYNGNNRRTSKTTGTTTTNYYWDRDYVAMEATGDTTVSNFITPFGIMGRTTDAGYTFYFRDIHGDVVTAFDSYDDRKNYSYDAFGIEKTPDGTDTNPIRYSGEYYDSESGLIYLRNRYYDPEMGRFISEDPIEDGLNWYAYCGNNPVKYVDPLGLTESLSSSAQAFIQYYDEKYNEAQRRYNECAASNDIIGAETASRQMRVWTAQLNDIRAKDMEGLIGGTILDVPVYQQPDTNLCWATCIDMVSDYFSGNRINDAVKIAQKVHGKKYNKPSYWHNLESPLKIVKYIQKEETLQMGQIQKQIDSGNPFGTLYRNEERNVGHWVVGVGYVTAPGHETLIIFNEPWDGIQVAKTYSEFQTMAGMKWSDTATAGGYR